MVLHVVCLLILEILLVLCILLYLMVGVQLHVYLDRILCMVLDFGIALHSSTKMRICRMISGEIYI